MFGLISIYLDFHINMCINIQNMKEQEKKFRKLIKVTMTI